MNLSYSYAGGFGAGVNVGEGLAAGVSYNEKSGFGVSAGVAADGVSLMYTENFGKGDVRASHGWQAQLGALEVNYDNLSGYSASLRAASTMFGDTNLKMTSSLTWSEQNGFNGSISYNLLTKEQMAKEAAKNAQKDTQKNQNSLLLNILDGLGFNLGGREGEPTLFDNIQGAFSGAWHQLTNPLETLGNIGNGFSKLGKGLAGLASDAWDGISGLFGGKKPETDYEISLRLANQVAQSRRDPIMTVAWDPKNNTMNDGSGSEVDPVLAKTLEEIRKELRGPGIRFGEENVKESLTLFGETVAKLTGVFGKIALGAYKLYDMASSNSDLYENTVGEKHIIPLVADLAKLESKIATQEYTKAMRKIGSELEAHMDTVMYLERKYGDKFLELSLVDERIKSDYSQYSNAKNNIALLQSEGAKVQQEFNSKVSQVASLLHRISDNNPAQHLNFKQEIKSGQLGSVFTHTKNEFGALMNFRTEYYNYLNRNDTLPFVTDEAYGKVKGAWNDYKYLREF